VYRSGSPPFPLTTDVPAPMEEKSLVPDSYYEYRRRVLRWRAGVLPTAGIYLLDGSYRVAVPGSGEERRLRREGALAVAGVTFDGSALETGPRGGEHRIAPCPAARLAAWRPLRRN